MRAEGQFHVEDLHREMILQDNGLTAVLFFSLGPGVKYEVG